VHSHHQLNRDNLPPSCLFSEIKGVGSQQWSNKKIAM
jgi:hypothetical protein